MSYIKILFLSLLFSTYSLSIFANCNEDIIDLDKAKPVMEKYFNELKLKSDIFQKIDNESIYLSKKFNYLSKNKKLEILTNLKLGFGEFGYLSDQNFNGKTSPYRVYDYLGRIISLPYDGCGNYLTLTEYARKNLEAIARGEDKRNNTHLIDPKIANEIKNAFYKLFSYDSAIYWIPESANFELDLYKVDNKKITRFINSFPKYKFFIMTKDGDFISEN